MANAYDPFEISKVDRLKQYPKGKVQELFKAPPPVPEPKVAATPSKTKWRVKKAKDVSINGCLTAVAAGQIISYDLYGEEGILRLIDQGVDMEEIT